MNCNGILTKSDTECYSCGEPLPKWARSSAVPKPKSKHHSVISNVIFGLSLALTGYCFIAPQKPPLTMSLAASGVLVLAKLIVDWTGKRRAATARG